MLLTDIITSGITNRHSLGTRVRKYDLKVKCSVRQFPLDSLMEAETGIC